MRTYFGAAIVLALSTTIAGCGGSPTATAPAGKSDLEKPVLKLGFIKLTDMAPLAIAKEKGYFAEEGLTVSLEPQANWKVLVDGVGSEAVVARWPGLRV